MVLMFFFVNYTIKAVLLQQEQCVM